MKILPIVLFNSIYILASIPLALARGNMEFLFYITMMIAFIALVVIVHLRVKLSYVSLWSLSVWGFMHMSGGLVNVPGSWPTNGSPVLYNLWLIPQYLKYDQFVHAFGFGVTTWVCWQCLSSMLCKSEEMLKPTIGKLTLVVAAGLGFGATNEMIEFITTLLVSETNVGGYVNTGWDLVSNFIGAFVAATLIHCQYNQKNKREEL